MFKCKICNKKFETLSGVHSHIENKHFDLIPKDLSVERYYYYLKTGKTNGNCVICKSPTTWNEVTLKYNRFCSNPQCKEKYVAEFKKRMIAKYGKVHLLNDPNKQREMLAKRKISGKYRWTSHEGEKTYTGSYELDFVRLMDVFFEWDPDDIMMPSPHTYTYDYNGEQKFYIPDVFIPSLDLEIEIKDGGDNPNNHHKIQDVDKVKEKLKDDVMLSQKSFHYIKITNKNYTNFFNFLKEIKNHFEKYGEDKKSPRIFMIEDIKTKTKPEVVKESVVTDVIKTFNKHVLNKNVNDIQDVIDKRVDGIKDTDTLNDFTEYLLKLTKTVESMDEYKTIEDTLNKVVDRVEKVVKLNPDYRDEMTNAVRNSIIKVQNENKKRRGKFKPFKESVEVSETNDVIDESVSTNVLSLYMVYDESKRPRQQFTLNDYESLVVVNGKYSLQRQPKTNLLKTSSFDKNEYVDQKVLEYKITCDNIDVKKIENIITEGNIKLFGLFDRGRFEQMFLNELCNVLQISNPEITFVGELDGGVI